jgi:hypothetical protein
MTRTATGSAAILLVAAFSLLANPAAAEQPGAGSPADAVCTEDVICVDSATVRTWPLERWSQVRRQIKQETAVVSPGTPTPVTR